MKDSVTRVVSVGMRSFRLFHAAIVIASATALDTRELRGNELTALPAADLVRLESPVAAYRPEPAVVATPIPDSDADPLASPFPGADSLFESVIEMPAGSETSPGFLAENQQTEDQEHCQPRDGLLPLHETAPLSDSDEDEVIPLEHRENSRNPDREDSTDEKEGGVVSLFQRFSLSSTYLDATGGENKKPIESRIREKAPSELRFTLFSIPLKN